MPFPDPKFAVAHGVLGTPAPVPRGGGEIETFIAAVREDFPNVLNRQVLPPEAPAGAPHLILQSTSSQLAVTGLQADFEAHFYGAFETDFDRCRDYIRRKMLAVFQGWQAVGAEVTVAGLILTMRFPLEGEDDGDELIRHLLATHLRPDVAADAVQDVHAQVTLRVADHYFVALKVTNYEMRQLERPIMPGTTNLVVAPWEGTVSERGYELSIDVNNKLRSIVSEQHTPVDEDELMRTLAVVERLADGVGARYVETGEFDLAALVEEVA